MIGTHGEDKAAVLSSLKDGCRAGE